MATIFTNSDIEITLTVEDENGAPIDLSSVDAVDAIVYIKKERILQSWTLADMTVTNPAAGEAVLIFDRANNTMTGKLFMQVAVTTTDAAYAGGQKVAIESMIEVATIKESV